MDKTEARVKLAIDAMGSDLGPSEVLEGVSQAINLAPRSTEFLLFGQEEILEPIISKHATLSQAKIELIHCPEVVGMEEKPMTDFTDSTDYIDLADRLAFYFSLQGSQGVNYYIW